VGHGRFAGLNCNEEAAWGPQIWENALSAQPPDFTAAEARQSKTESHLHRKKSCLFAVDNSLASRRA